MKTRILTLIAALCGAQPTNAAVPTSIIYQGVVQVDGSDYSGTGLFKFALVSDSARGDLTRWSHDGTSALGSEPSSSIKIAVNGGLFTIGLGDISVPNMTEPIDPADIDYEDVRLRVWFSDEVNGFVALSPDRPLRAVPYALQAASLIDGAIDGSQITANSIGSEQIAGDLKLIDLDLGNLSADGDLRLLGRHTGGGIVNPGEENERVRLYADAPGTLVPNPTLGGGLDLFDQSETRRVSLRADGALLSLTESDGNTGLFLRGDTLSGGGAMSIFQDDGDTAIQLLGQQSATSGGVLSVYDSAGNERVKALGVNGTVRLFSQGSTATTLRMTGDDGELVALDSIGIANSVGDNLLKASLAKNADGGQIRTRRSDNQNSTLLSTDPSSGGGVLALHDASGDVTAELEAANSPGGGGRLQLREADNSLSVRLGAQGAGGGGFLTLNDGSGGEAIVLDSVAGDGSAVVRMRDGDGNVVIELDADEGGEAVIRTQVLEITGGSDLSEKFDIAPAPGQYNTPPAPGALVCIDPDNPGDLITSSRAYDRTVAGIVSGAGGVKPGMLMGQRGSIADGAMPVALTGRVYCLADASFGPIEPGDLLTTSDTPGHGMRVGDHGQATGSVIGKAMTRLESGRGLVLVLVSLQ